MKQPTLRRAGSLTAALLLAALAVLGVASPATAGGTPYSPYNWAEIHAAQWKDSNGAWQLPSRVTAQWQIPCLSTTDNRYGAYDQWIGIEGSQGTQIQVGVRSYHIDTGWGLSTGYFAWVVDTRDAAARTPRQLFTIARCGVGIGLPRVYAEVNANGWIHLNVTDSGNTSQPTEYHDKWSGISAPEIPRYGTFALERFTSSVANRLPWFGTARFEWCWVGSVTTSGHFLGNPQYVTYGQSNMLSLLPRPPWTAARTAVWTGSPNIHGDVNFTQWYDY